MVLGFGSDIVQPDDVGVLQLPEDAQLMFEVGQIGGFLLEFFDGVELAVVLGQLDLGVQPRAERLDDLELVDS